jgi:hypothetical protein
MHPLWNRLRLVRLLSFLARSRSRTAWTGTGVGTVELRRIGDGVVVWHEQGSWRPEDGPKDIRFTNVYRWTLLDDLLRLEHLRFGESNPVHLFDLAQVGEWEWRPASPHLCREDCYSAVLLLCESAIVLRWSIDGPRKQEKIEYEYR